MESYEISNWIKQPNRITYARYEFNEIQENILTLIMGELQPYLTEEKIISKDLFETPFVTIDLTKLSDKRNNYTYIKKQAFKMKFIEINYTWFDEVSNNLKERSAMVLTTMDYTPRIKKLDIYLNPHVVPYLVYIGTCSKGKYTQYNQKIAIDLRGYLAKRIYKFLSSWKLRGATKISILEFKQILFIENKYNQLSELRRLLNTTRNKLQKDADLSFEFSFEKRESINESYITFLIFPKATHPLSTKIQIERHNQFSTVYNVLSHWFSNSESDFALSITHKIMENEKLTPAYYRLKNMYKQYRKKDKSFQDCRNNILTNCLKDWGIK
ncbi:MAG TPA: replication initiation protein [Moheibacter sp.]|nr:replication initiation protein [Moheibacter sp.]